MPVDTDQILKFLSELASEDSVKQTVKQTFRSVLITCAAVGAGGLLGGPIGVVIGAIVGSAGAIATGEDFKSIFQALSKIDETKKELLAEDVRKIMQNVNVTDVAVFAGMVANNATLKTEVVDTLVGFLKNEMPKLKN